MTSSIFINAAVADPTESISATQKSIPYAYMQHIDDGDSDAVKVEKAAKVLPRPNQTRWMRYEREFFLQASRWILLVAKSLYKSYGCVKPVARWEGQ